MSALFGGDLILPVHRADRMAVGMHLLVIKSFFFIFWSNLIGAFASAICPVQKSFSELFEEMITFPFLRSDY